MSSVVTSGCARIEEVEAAIDERLDAAQAAEALAHARGCPARRTATRPSVTLTLRRCP